MEPSSYEKTITFCKWLLILGFLENLQGLLGN